MFGRLADLSRFLKAGSEAVIVVAAARQGATSTAIGQRSGASARKRHVEVSFLGPRVHLGLSGPPLLVGPPVLRLIAKLERIQVTPPRYLQRRRKHRPEPSLILRVQTALNMLLQLPISKWHLLVRRPLPVGRLLRGLPDLARVLTQVKRSLVREQCPIRVSLVSERLRVVWARQNVQIVLQLLPDTLDHVRVTPGPAVQLFMGFDAPMVQSFTGQGQASGFKLGADISPCILLLLVEKRVHAGALPVAELLHAPGRDTPIWRCTFHKSLRCFAKLSPNRSVSRNPTSIRRNFVSDAYVLDLSTPVHMQRAARVGLALLGLGVSAHCIYFIFRLLHFQELLHRCDTYIPPLNGYDLSALILRQQLLLGRRGHIAFRLLLHHRLAQLTSCCLQLILRTFPSKQALL